MTPVTLERPSEAVPAAVWSAWAAYLEHLQPSRPDGAEPCFDCFSAPALGEGCEEGQSLWGVYRLTLVIGGTQR